jgi:large subunit ribosomal protein L10
MTRADKEAAVAELVDSFEGSSAAVLTEYRGLSVKQLQDLRRSLGESATYAIVKNTLTQIAAKQAGVEGVQEMLLGPTAIAFVKGDVVEAAKGLRDFAKANPALVVKGGYFEGKSLDAKEIAKLADLESREVLLAKLAGAMMASLNEAVYLLNAPLAQAARAVGALQAKAEQDPSVIGGAGTPEQSEDSTDQSTEDSTEPAQDSTDAPGMAVEPEENPAPAAETPDEAPAGAAVDVPSEALTEATSDNPDPDASSSEA